MRILFAKDGTASHIHDETLSELMAGVGECQIKRASHVEPYNEMPHTATAIIAADVTRGKTPPPKPNDWFSDLTVSGGPVAGPFPTRDAALKYEREWLEQNIFGVKI